MTSTKDSPDAIGVADSACGAMMAEAMQGLLARGMTPSQLRDSMMGGAIGMALKSGWSVDEVARVAREYAELLSKLTTASASKA